jgi:Fic family protein
MEKLYREWRAAQPLKPEIQRRMDRQFMIDFNYNSNHLEGNTLTYGQTKLLLLFGRTEGKALMRDYEEMKAHNVGLELIKREALDRRKPLSEIFIRELNHTILAGDFYKLSRGGEYRYKIHAGVYKTRPNSVITPSGEIFDYASPEETPAMMADLLAWFRGEEENRKLNPVEIAAIFHYRYIRIHPFEDGNGRIARLLVNYILLRNGYPMIVIPSSDRNRYLEVLGQCDKIAGMFLFDGASAGREEVEPFIAYIGHFVKKKLALSVQMAKGEIAIFHETDVPENMTDSQRQMKNSRDGVPENVPESDAQKRQTIIVGLIKMNGKISAAEIADLLKVHSKTIKRDLQLLKEKGIITREGTERGGRWEITD